MNASFTPYLWPRTYPPLHDPTLPVLRALAARYLLATEMLESHTDDHLNTCPCPHRHADDYRADVTRAEGELRAWFADNPF